MAEESNHSPTRNEPASLPTSRPDPPTDPASKPLVANDQDDAEVPEKGEISTHQSSTLRWNSFSWEILAFFLSTGLLIAIVAILAHYDRQPQPNWDRVSLNSVISWLSTLSKACVLFCISEGLGQLKWVWFVQKVRPMSDLQDFDSASRGIWGSMQLIWSLRARHFATFASLAVVLGIAFDPFMQNLIRYYPKLVADGSETAFVARGDRYNAFGTASHHLTYVDTVMKANVYNSLFNTDPTKPWSTPKYTCSTGNCTWDPMASIQWRSNCTNITDRLQYSCEKGNNTFYVGEPSENLVDICSVSVPRDPGYSNITAEYLPGKPFSTPIVIGEGNPIVYTNTSIVQRMGPVQMIGPDSLVSSTKMEELMWSNKTKWQAMECIIYPVAHSFRPNVTGGVYHEETLAIWDGEVTEYNDTNATYLAFKPPWGPELGLEKNQSLEFSYSSTWAMKEFYQYLLNGKVSVDPWGPQFDAISYAEYATVDAIQAISHAEIIDCPYNTVRKLECAMDNMAQAMTKTFRDNSHTTISSSSTQVRGQALSNMTYVAVHWQWISLPIVVWLLGLATLIGTTWKTRRYGAPVWKNEVSPLFGLHGDEKHKMIRQGIHQAEIVRL